MQALQGERYRAVTHKFLFLKSYIYVVTVKKKLANKKKNFLIYLLYIHIFSGG